MTPWILDQAAAATSEHVGGKARALARAAAAGLPVPRFIVVSAAACVDCRKGTSLELEPRVGDAIDAALATLCPEGVPIAVRSSAADEDGVRHSFAGQLDSFLDVPCHDVRARVVDVWRSAFGDRALVYRRERGLTGQVCPPAVILQRMIVPRASGVAFSADPVSGRRSVAVVSAVRGAGSALVSGEADAETWHVTRDAAIVSVAKRAGESVLGDEEIRNVAALARAAARVFQCPQDIEWAIGDGLVLLQSRPITSLASRPDPDGRLAIWDNSNLVESYSGVTTPLTFSFAREIYPPVYRQFCRMMGVSRHAIARQDDVFENVLGLIRGRLYYNLLNWYRILALLPGYRLNRRFMEQMMGVSEPLADAVADRIATEVTGSRLGDLLHLPRTVVSLLASYVTLDRRVGAFYQRLDEALRPPLPPLDQRTADELVVHYRKLRSRLLLAWDAPLANDFFAMIAYGMLGRLLERWCGKDAVALRNDLIAGNGGMVSAEPVGLLQEMARLSSAERRLIEYLTTGDTTSIRAELEGHPDLSRLVGAYLAKFGDRTFNELKLESLTLHDDPLPLFRAIGSLARQMRAVSAEAVKPATGAGRRMAARAVVDRALAGHPIRRRVFGWMLTAAARRVRDRENLRFERTRLFARVRGIFLELGRRFHSIDLLEHPRDVFYLEVGELLAFVDGRSTTSDLRPLVAVRRGEFEQYAAEPPPDSRFETRGLVYQGHTYQRVAPSRGSVSAPKDERRGLGCSPGIARGRVCVVHDPRSVNLGEPAILVARHTDPGWILVFPSALAVIVERGSPLSHAAIVARELGIPAVVSVAGATEWLEDGAWVEVDGSAGIVRRIPQSNPRVERSLPTESAVAHA